MIRIAAYNVMCDYCGRSYNVSTSYLAEVKMDAQDKGWVVGAGRGMKVEMTCPFCGGRA